MKRLVALSLCLMMVLLAVAGCSPSSDGDKTGGLEAITYSMATGPADGGATIQGTAWADVVKRLAGLNVKVVTSGGYLANVAFVENGDADLGIASAGLFRAALNGEADFVITRVKIFARLPHHAEISQFSLQETILRRWQI